MSRKVGRPAEKTNAREKLILKARELFTQHPYEKVSTRLLAEKAGVNMAMIRYYFGSKDGLFETMLRETLAPMKEHIGQTIKETSCDEDFLGIMKTYYGMMSKIPDFPRLVCRIMMMEESAVQRKLMEKVFMEIAMPAQQLIFHKFQSNGVLKPDLDPLLCKVSYISLMVFPFIAPPQLLKIHEVSLDEDFLARLLEHNLQLLSRGFLISPSEKQDQNYEE
ncbi:putative Transcriptional regulator [Vibrio nigripulchritudo SFn27]|uniref:Putative Transcriptional regulator n=1 Tax=Vibrio nigripulchritudo TaxID=28173 RepID=U4KED7_9VIBR|nr:TetR/AcrR family transcriptional regulator [Vibrio nigripulchritudo]CCN84782.1 putative Transcriptional regulator [Vibrio nigripulchritudo BLFn1]CCN87725.1 putative Transcriptional regulator [Vibrio nigripulchritudo SFn27]CCN95779.1 putative Transcriptional regulator [Vibrio nigripulchritudo ENn2]CCO38937.1 putative Transcriptional regulator [Vibrio nigripulchritudo SFn135]CCO51896.1 putative Transcriptional regulator [Vibrio nigripulchritudo Wn13]